MVDDCENSPRNPFGGLTPNKHGEAHPCICHQGCWWYIPCPPGRAIPLDQEMRRHAWNVGSLSRALGFSPRGFCRMVERCVGLQAKTWLRQQRIVAACHLLREGWKIEALAVEFGFHHCSAFTREFKAQIGVTPSYYVRMERRRFFLPPPDEDE